MTRMRTSQRSASQCWAKLQSQHRRSAETTQAAMLIWLAMEVKLNVGCCKLIRKEGEGISECCVLFLEERASLQLLPKGVSPTVDVDPVHGSEYCHFIAQLLQHPEFRVRPAEWCGRSGTSSGWRRKSSGAKAVSSSGKLRCTFALEKNAA